MVQYILVYRDILYVLQLIDNQGKKNIKNPYALISKLCKEKRITSSTLHEIVFIFCSQPHHHLFLNYIPYMSTALQYGYGNDWKALFFFKYSTVHLNV